MTDERLELAMERIADIPGDTGVDRRFHDFFIAASSFLSKVFALKKKIDDGTYRNLSLSAMQAIQADLYRDMLPEHYETGYLNPDYAAACLGEAAGRPLSALYAELFAGLRYVFAGDDEGFAPFPELFLHVYGLFTGGEVPDGAAIEDRFYWYASDYLDVTVPERTRDLFCPATEGAGSTAAEMAADPRRLFMSGDYISADTLRTAAFLGSLPEEKIRRAASAFTEGFRNGFTAMSKDMSRKKIVGVRYMRGFERIAAEAERQFREMGLVTVYPRAPQRLASRLPAGNAGCRSAGPNPQCEYDHRYDCAIVWRKAFTDRRLSLLRTSFEACRSEAALFAGPAAMDTFGEKPFQPVNRRYAYAFDEKQKDLLGAYSAAAAQIREAFIPEAEISYTMIAWPVPETGPDFPEIFAEILKINTMDSQLYGKMQQKIIDVFDRGEYARIKGAPGNDTDLIVRFRKLADPAKETKFENCVADVNIPVGEAFTSPVLRGTEGMLHVSEVFIDGILLKDLRIRFRDGMIQTYSCANFQNAEENRRLVRELILHDHRTLPLGEFAVGTNTTACEAARRLDIQRLLPILIAEKTGPHFAVGDTCYVREEDVMTYNPDGKAIIARDNEISALRHEKPEEAYFGCHTDITIPYEEIGLLSSAAADGTETAIIRDGRFVLPGLEPLNEPLDRMKREA